MLHVHETGSRSALPHHAGAPTVRAAGVRELRLGVEDLIVADQALLTARVNDPGTGRASIDMWTTGAGAVDVHSVHVPAYAMIVDRRSTVFTPPVGHHIRLRSRRDGAVFGAWSAWSTAATLVTPGLAPTTIEAIDDFEVEIQRAAGPVIATHGYVKIKKLNSGG